MPHRYFTTEISDGTAVLRGADAHHLSRVMRGKLGDTVILCDGSAVEYTATLTGFGDETVEFSVEPGYPSAAEPTVIPSCILAPPEQQNRMTGSPCFVASSNERVIFSPTTYPMEAMRNLVSMAPITVRIPPMVASPMRIASSRWNFSFFFHCCSSSL